MKSIILKATSVVMSLIIFTMSSQAIASSKVIKTIMDINSMSSEEVFRGVIFREGSLALQLFNKEDIEFTNNLNDDIKENLNATKAKIIQVIKSENPRYLSDFKSKIVSGDHFKVYNALVDAQEYVKSIVKTQYKLTDSEIDKYSKGGDPKAEITKLSADRNACIAVLIALVLVLLKLLVIPFAPDGDVSPEVSRLENEQLATTLVELSNK